MWLFKKRKKKQNDYIWENIGVAHWEIKIIENWLRCLDMYKEDHKRR